MYHVMLILTDGDIHDMIETVDLIVALSLYPVSIIIIGIGKDEFEKMNFLDSGDRQHGNAFEDRYGWIRIHGAHAFQCVPQSEPFF